MTEAEVVSVLVAVITTIGIVGAAALSAGALYFSRRNAHAIDRTHVLINSRMDELIAAAEVVARAEGYRAGEKAERDRAWVMEGSESP